MSYLQTLAPTQRVIPLTGNTVVVTQTRAPLALILVPAGTLAALTITLPTGAYDGQVCTLMTTQILTALTVNSASGSIVGDPLTTLVANAGARYLWNVAATTWYRVP